MDQLLGEMGQGRDRRRLYQLGELIGLVVGRFNEVSNDLNNLIDQMAESRVDLVARREGRLLHEQEREVVVGHLRR